MRKLIFLAFVFAVMSAFTVAVHGQSVQRISFKKGGTTAVVTGTLSGYKSKRVFVIKVRAGQTLTAKQTGRNPISVWIKDPSGDDAGDMDMSCHSQREITPTVAGDYKLEVVECQKADRWKGTFKMRVTVR